MGDCATESVIPSRPMVACFGQPLQFPFACSLPRPLPLGQHARRCKRCAQGKPKGQHCQICTHLQNLHFHVKMQVKRGLLFRLTFGRFGVPAPGRPSSVQCFPTMTGKRLREPVHAFCAQVQERGACSALCALCAGYTAHPNAGQRPPVPGKRNHFLCLLGPHLSTCFSPSFFF